MKTRIWTVGAAAAATAFAHFTWVSPADVAWEVGKTAAVRISHGHQLGHSEEAVNMRGAEFFVVAPSGQRTALEPATAGTAVSANFTVKERGVHRIVLVQDRGVISRTPKGVQPGGRDAHPDAAQAYRPYRSAVAYAGAAQSGVPGAKPAGIEFELAGEFANGAWQLTLLNHGKPVAGANVEVLPAGAKEGVPAGKTGADGRISYRPPAGAKGPALFSAEWKAPPPAGARYDSVNYSTSLYVNW